jgi:perosamine synthetase
MIERVALPTVFDRSGRAFGREELELLRQVLDSGALAGDRGRMVGQLEKEFASKFGMTHGIALNSGTAAVHCCLAALGVGDGDEVITSALTDMGAITPILFQGAVPVFADIERETLTISRDTVSSKITGRTRAIIVTHLFGNPADIEGIVELAQSRGVAVIEDCAQAYFAMSGDKPVGGFGDLACYSLHQTKHITCGEGGMALTDSQEWADRMRSFANKGLAHHTSPPEYIFPGLSYRMNELSAAVALAQLRKLDEIIDRRRQSARNLSRKISKIPGLSVPQVLPGCQHSYWAFPLLLDLEALQMTVGGFCGHLRSMGVPSLPSYIGQPVFEAPFAKDALRLDPCLRTDTQRQSGSEETLRRAFPALMDILPRLVVIPWNERYEEPHVDMIAAALDSAVDRALTMRSYVFLLTTAGLRSQRASAPVAALAQCQLDGVADLVDIVKELLRASPYEGRVERLLQQGASGDYSDSDWSAAADYLLERDVARSVGGFQTPSATRVTGLLRSYGKRIHRLNLAIGRSADARRDRY